MRILLSLFLTIQIGAMAQVDIVNKEVNGLTFKCRVAGDSSGEPVILLHGFPETSHMWIPLMERLSENGFYCVAPDQRGYSPDARPTDVKAYEIEKLVSDIVGLADAFGFKKFQLIGHDWGSAIGWAVVGFHPDRIKSWTALSVPHLRAFSDAIRFDKKQKKMSRYMGWFQWRGLPEWLMLRNDRSMLKKTWRESSESEKEDYLKVLGNKPGLKAAIAYYRANNKVLKKGQKLDNHQDIHTPTLLLWGKKDFAIGSVGIDGTAQYMKGPYKRIDLDASHWLIQEVFEECANPILIHLNEYR